MGSAWLQNDTQTDRLQPHELCWVFSGMRRPAPPTICWNSSKEMTPSLFVSYLAITPSSSSSGNCNADSERREDAHDHHVRPNTHIPHTALFQPIFEVRVRSRCTNPEPCRIPPCTYPMLAEQVDLAPFGALQEIAQLLAVDRSVPVNVRHLEAVQEDVKLLLGLLIQYARICAGSAGAVDVSSLALNMAPKRRPSRVRALAAPEGLHTAHAGSQHRAKMLSQPQCCCGVGEDMFRCGW